jgi:tetratricopeptide (TPR) repeat protein
MKKLGVVILLTYVFAISVNYYAYSKYRANSNLFTQMLYLPSGKYLKPISFGYHALLSDFVYLWSIQYYGDPIFSPKMEYLKHTYDIITDLDPNYIDAYQTGALFMFYEGRNPAAGLELLDRGLQKNPNEWILPADAGFYCYMNLKDKARAIEYFNKVTKIPTAPAQAKRFLAGMHFQIGDRRIAYDLWKEVYETADKPHIKQIAYQHMHDLKVLVDIDTLEKAIQQYQKQNGKLPDSLEQLYTSRFVTENPVDPDGRPYGYDPRTGKVEYSQELKIYKRYQ